MKLQVGGIEIEIPNNARVDVSEDGKKVSIGLPEAVETIRVVETPGPAIETIRIVEVEKACDKKHYPWPYSSLPQYPNTVPYSPYTWTTTTGTIQPTGDLHMVGYRNGKQI
jgi:hypothetical protein